MAIDAIGVVFLVMLFLAKEYEVHCYRKSNRLLRQSYEMACLRADRADEYAKHWVSFYEENWTPRVDR